jgi:hypothetical protein
LLQLYVDASDGRRFETRHFDVNAVLAWLDERE